MAPWDSFWSFCVIFVIGKDELNTNQDGKNKTTQNSFVRFQLMLLSDVTNKRSNSYCTKRGQPTLNRTNCLTCKLLKLNVPCKHQTVHAKRCSYLRSKEIASNPTALAASTSASSSQSLIICEGQSFLISCPGSSTISIVTANYGRTSTAECTHKHGPPQFLNTNCRWDATDKLKER